MLLHRLFSPQSERDLALIDLCVNAHVYLKPKDIEYCNGGVLSLLVSDVVDTGYQPGEQPSIEGLSQGISVGKVSVWRKGDREKREGKEKGRQEKREGKEEGDKRRGR